jgi:hypothetical protein
LQKKLAGARASARGRRAIEPPLASGDVKPIVDVKFKVKITFQAHIGHFEEKFKPKSVPSGVRGSEVKHQLIFHNK